MTVYTIKSYTRELIKENPNTLFVFGDNIIRQGYGGQAATARGEPNSVGIPTKHFPDNSKSSFFTNNDFDLFLTSSKNSIEKLTKHVVSGKDVVLPYDGIGTGLAQLNTKAPKIFNEINKIFDELVANSILVSGEYTLVKRDNFIIQMFMQQHPNWDNQKIVNYINDIPEMNYNFSVEDVDKLKLIATLTSDGTILKKSKIKYGWWRKIAKDFDNVL